MGKSIQGAGGILVLGSVFQNIIERTHTVSAEKELGTINWEPPVCTEKYMWKHSSKCPEISLFPDRTEKMICG